MTASIIYKPHCSVCGAELPVKKVYYRQHEQDLSFPGFLKTYYTTFEPERCESCGAFFTSAEITLPEKKEDE